MPAHKISLLRMKDFDVNIIKFVEAFPDEKSCKDHFKIVREQEGIIF
jgi:hypothetical protein